MIFPSRTLLIAVLLSTAALASAEQPASPAPPAPSPEQFAACVTDLRAEALKRGIDNAAFDGWFADVQPDAQVLVLMDKQPEFVMQPWDYLALLVDEKRVAEGRRKRARYSELLERIEATYGVDGHILVALWGVETRFGELMGGRPLVRSLATVSCFGRRTAFFREELLAALRILKDGDVPLEHMVGSWAGAFGQTQFMPSTFRRVAVDFDGDGKRDIVASVPDALASTANYLSKSGWKKGEPWGFEASVPRKYTGPSGRRNKHPMAYWRDLGVKLRDGRALPGDESAALLMPAGNRGPAFIVMGNFQALIAYNPAEAYALAIAHLSDRLRGGGPFQTSWPVGEPALSREQRISMQARLAARGFDVGEPDGILGPRTIDAIKEFQKSIGLTPDGFPTLALLKRM